MKKFLIFPVIFIIGCAGKQPPLSKIICDSWIVLANNPRKITGTGQDVPRSKDFWVSIDSLQGDKHKIMDIDLLIKDAENGENLIALAPENPAQHVWVIADPAEWEKYKKIIEAAQGDFLYATLRIHYRDERNNFTGIFYTKPAPLPVEKKEAPKSDDTKSDEATLKWGEVTLELLPPDEIEGILLRLWVKDLSDKFHLFGPNDPANLKIYKLTDIDNLDSLRGVIKFKSGSFKKTIYPAQNENDMELAEIIRSIHRNAGKARAIDNNDIAIIVKGTASKRGFKPDPSERELANFVNERCFHWIKDTRALVLAPLNVAGRDYDNEQLPELRAVQTGKFIKDVFATEIKDIEDRVFPIYGEPEGEEGKDEEIHRRIDLYFIIKPKLYQAKR
jgi:hypothetical protein